MATSVNTSRVATNFLELKFLAIGDSGVGKTSLLNQYVDAQFTPTLGSTVGIDIRDKHVPYQSPKSNKSYTIHLQLWDTAGQERYRGLTSSFFRDAVGFLLVFDVTNERSFVNVRNWITEIRENVYSENVDIILVGNKCDLEAERAIDKAHAMELAKECSFEYIETSARENINVAKSVDLLLNAVINRLENNEKIDEENPPLPRPLDHPVLLGRRPSIARGTSYCCNY